ncbi:MAG: winged helix-turn-helix domain-containing protein [Chloroflexi bacterium]|nr:winged helix-turn-helix domain-containing protein [Chloroflexota bacterium]
MLDQQSEQVRNFLISTSILQQINAELAERLAGVQDGAGILSDLEQRGLFTNRLDADEARYRYHGLFRDFLERRLTSERSEGEVTGLHIHAASYFETHEQWPQAIHHYLKAGLTPQAARLIARYGEDVVSEGRLGLVDEWLQQLPAKAIRDNARLSLLYGEACGIRGDWDNALVALSRARSFFAKKGDPRMEALACLKTSTVMSNMGQVEGAAEQAVLGLRLAPPDAFATRLRLNGNLAITSTWMNGPLHAVAHELRRIAVEAKSRGLEHFAAIALHNHGMLLRQIGDLDGSLKSLEQATRFWSDLPASPFADNAELVQSLLYRDDTARAERLANAGVMSTLPWARPQAEAQYGRAAVLNHQGRFEESAEVLRHVLADPAALGATAEIGSGLLIESLYLGTADVLELREVLMNLAAGPSDPRQALVMAPARAIATHVSTECRGQCLDEARVLEEWDRRGAALLTAVGLVKLGVLALEHHGARARQLSRLAIARARAVGVHRYLRWWLRRYATHATWIVEQDRGIEAMLSFAEADPDGWRGTIAEMVDSLTGEAREAAVAFLASHGTVETAAALRSTRSQDIGDLRRALISKHAPSLFIRSFGAIVVHRGSWLGQTSSIEKRRMRALLALLVANYRSTLTREMALDILWPESDPSSAINSLNQAVFQLRRVLDPSFRDGESPQYVLSTVDALQLNPAHTVTDLDQFRRIADELGGESGDPIDRTAALVDIVRGEFLAELRYEDWAIRLRTAVHAEVRNVLLPIAMGSGNASSDTAVRAACALLELDPYDEEAQLAMARQLDASGRRAAARTAILRFAKRLKDDLDERPSGELAAALAGWVSPRT